MINLHISLWKTGKTLAFCGATSALLFQPYRPLVFVGESMTPTYQSGEYVTTVPATPSNIERGDVVVIEMSDGPIVKRVAYLPGDKIPQMNIKGNWIDLIEVTSPPSRDFDGKSYRKRVIPEGEVYVLGDNRTISLDSREFGPVSMSQISRKVIEPRDRVR